MKQEINQGIEDENSQILRKKILKWENNLNRVINLWEARNKPGYWEKKFSKFEEKKILEQKILKIWEKKYIGTKNSLNLRILK